MTETVVAAGTPTHGLVRPRQLRANAVLAFAADVTSKVSLGATVVLCVHLLSTSEFALFGVCLSAGTLVGVLLDAGFGTLITREGAADAAVRGALLRLSLWARLPVLAAGLAGVAVLAVTSDWGAPAATVLAYGFVSAIALTVLAVFRSAQTLVVEAWQKLAAALVSVAVVAAVALRFPHAWAVLAALAAALGLSLVPLQRLVRPLLSEPAAALSVWRVWRVALPLGVMGFATLLYYRAPILILGASGSAADTAAFTVASTVAFGLLAVPNAISTGLLPRLAARETADRRAAIERQALQVTVALSLVVAAAAALMMPLVGPSLFGRGYHGVYLPFLILLAATVLIGPSSTIGTALIADGRTAVVAGQVVVVIPLNIGLAYLLVPVYGARGAAAATLATEVFAVAWLACARWRLSWHVLLERVDALGVVFVAALAGLFGLELWAVHTGYSLRLISDSPTYLALLPQMAAHPWQPVEPFLTAATQGDPHDSLYTQGLASAFRWWHGSAVAPLALARFLGWVGIAMSGVFLHALYLWMRSLAGARTAQRGLLVLLVLFGPAQVIWAGDFTFNGLLYASYYPQTVAMAALLYVLVLVQRPQQTVPRVAAGVLLSALTMTVHPFTGVLLGVLLMLHGITRAYQRQEGWATGGWWLAGGYLLALAWPAYSVSAAFADSGAPAPLLIATCVLAPCAVRLLPRTRLTGHRVARVVVALDQTRIDFVLASLGAVVVLALALWETWLFGQPNSDPLIHSNHLALYWVESRWRWLLMLAAGSVGLSGLLRLWRRSQPLPLLWFGGCYAAGAAGAVGLPLQVWWRFLLFCQIPLAIGAGHWFGTAAPAARRARLIAVATLGAVAVFKVATLTLLPPTVRYFNTPLQQSYALGAIVPRQPGIVASDPFTSYFVPGSTGHRVLVVTKAHTASRAELARATAGYRLLHRFYMGRNWWAAAQEMYRQGVRYVLIEKSTSLRPPTLEMFSTGPTPLVRTHRDRRLLGIYYYRNNRVGHVVYDRTPYTLYRLDPRRLF